MNVSFDKKSLSQEAAEDRSLTDPLHPEKIPRRQKWNLLHPENLNLGDTCPGSVTLTLRLKFEI